jgi:hypothetical protein
MFKKAPADDKNTASSKAKKSKEPGAGHPQQPPPSALGQLAAQHHGHAVHSTDVNIEMSNLATSLESVLVLVNSKSGAPKVCQTVLERVRQLLPPENVFDLATAEPRACLNKFKHVEDLTLIVGGGDGTVSW